MSGDRRGNAASVRARLEAMARERGAELQLVLSEFATERLLYRLGISRHASRFLLKGIQSRLGSLRELSERHLESTAAATGGSPEGDGLRSGLRSGRRLGVTEG